MESSSSSVEQLIVEARRCAELTVGGYAALLVQLADALTQIEADRQEADEGLHRARKAIGAKSEDICNDIIWLQEERDDARAECERLRSALKWYANPGNYSILSGSDYQMYAARTMVDWDGGRIASEAIREQERK